VADQTPLGKQAGDYINRGALVRTLSSLIWWTALQVDDCKHGFIADGFPRRLSGKFGCPAGGLRMSLNCVLSVKVPQAEIIARLSGRRAKIAAVCFTSLSIRLARRRLRPMRQRANWQKMTGGDDQAPVRVYENQTAPWFVIIAIAVCCVS
jgi:adenylate kinase family enzyme